MELDAFVACQVSGTIEVERSAIAQLLIQRIARRIRSIQEAIPTCSN